MPFSSSLADAYLSCSSSILVKSGNISFILAFKSPVGVLLLALFLALFLGALLLGALLLGALLLGVFLFLGALFLGALLLGALFLGVLFLVALFLGVLFLGVLFLAFAFVPLEGSCATGSVFFLLSLISIYLVEFNSSASLIFICFVGNG